MIDVDIELLMLIVLRLAQLFYKKFFRAHSCYMQTYIVKNLQMPLLILQFWENQHAYLAKFVHFLPTKILHRFISTYRCEILSYNL